jgi:cytochrome c553
MLPRFAATLMLFAVAVPPGRAADDVDEFEKKIRPILVEHCAKCHSRSANKLKGSLSLDGRDTMLKGGDTGPALVPGDPERSLLVRAIRHGDSELKMPPRGKLPDEQIAAIERWIKNGAKAPNAQPAKAPRSMDDIVRTHWSLQPLHKPAIPPVARAGWIRNPIDAFVLARLEAAGLSPAPAAEPLVLLRRLHFDLTGIPPTPEEIDAFRKEDAEPALRRTINRLLASPQHGERWARHWLDVARYADSAGYELDSTYGSAWRYRDYVIRSFNVDKPLDRFLQEQIAGDELWPDSEEAKIATGLCTLGPYAFEGGIGRPKVVEYQRLTDIVDTVGSSLLGLTVGCARCHDHKFDPISQADYFGLQAIFAGSELHGIKISGDRREDTGDMRVLGNRTETPATHLLRRGELDAPGDEVGPGLPRRLPGGGPIDVPAGKAEGRRTALARWLVAKDNPLPARVLANRVWQWHFGKGLVRTPSDFGVQGEPPTHPELLDFLAAELVASGWSMRHLDRLILDSATYRMASTAPAGSATRDPDHRLLSRFPRRRLEAEVVWDHLHAAAGSLNSKMFGPAVVPPVDAEVLKTLLNARWKVTEDPAERNRRGIYLVVRRSLPLPLFETFNIAGSVESCPARPNTVVVGQALTLLNNDVIHEQARTLAGRLLRECPDDALAQVRRAWLLVFSRPATTEEETQAVAFLARRTESLGSARPPLAPIGAPASAHGGALAEWCLALFSANEFLYVD